jgi:2-aminoadipate transaminase
MAVGDLAHSVQPLETPWADRYAQRNQSVRSSVIRELLKLAEQPEIISFAGGLPAPEVFPTAEIEAAARRVLERSSALALQYGATEGYAPLRELLALRLRRYGVEAKPSNVIVTTGSQQALDLLGRLFLNPGDHVVSEEPTYLGAIQAWRACQAEFLTVPMDEDGLRLEPLEEALRHGPKFIYVLPNFQNPTGTTMSLSRRQRLVELARSWGVPIVEDDPYGQLRYEGTHLPPLLALDAQHDGRGGGRGGVDGAVIHLGTFSKTLAPGLRLGWLVAPAEVIERVVRLKQAADLHTSSLTQMIAYEAARGAFPDRHVGRIRKVYSVRRDAMLSALARHMPAGVRWTRPQGGLFLWVTLPAGLDSALLLEEALQQERVAFIPGDAFHPNGGGRETLRLSFSYSDPGLIEEGVARLGRLLARHLPEGALP